MEYSFNCYNSLSAQKMYNLLNDLKYDVDFNEEKIINNMVNKAFKELRVEVSALIELVGEIKPYRETVVGHEPNAPYYISKTVMFNKVPSSELRFSQLSLKLADKWLKEIDGENIKGSGVFPQKWKKSGSIADGIIRDDFDELIPLTDEEKLVWLIARLNKCVEKVILSELPKTGDLECLNINSAVFRIKESRMWLEIELENMMNNKDQCSQMTNKQ